MADGNGNGHSDVDLRALSLAEAGQQSAMGKSEGATPDLTEYGDTGFGYWGWVSPGTERRIREIETLPQLRGMNAYKVYDQMRLGDPKIWGLLSAVDLPLLAADWRIDSADSKNDLCNERADFVKSVLFERPCYSWRSTLQEILLFRPLGYSAFEIIWRVDDDGKDVIDRLAYRPPNTIWWIWGADGRISHVEQIIFGHWLTIDGDKLCWFTNMREGENWRGRPALRPLYKPWYAKVKLELQLLILTEKMGGVPTFKIGSSVNTRVQAELQEAGRNWAIAERMFLMYPEDVEFALVSTQVKASDVIKEIEYYDLQMSNTLIAQVLDLGKTATGSRALGETLGDMFQLSCEAAANQIEDEFNRPEGLIWQICHYNFKDGDDPDLMPKLRSGKIGKVDPLVFGQGLNNLAQAGLSFNDQVTMNYVRQILGMPQLDSDDLADLEPPSGLVGPDGLPITAPAGPAQGGTLPVIPGLPSTPGGATAGQLQQQSDAEAMKQQNAAALQAGISPETQPDAKANVPLPTETEQTNGALQPKAIKNAKQAAAAKPQRQTVNPVVTTGAVNPAAASPSPQPEGQKKVQPNQRQKPVRGSLYSEAEIKVRLAEGKTWRDPHGIELFVDLAEIKDGFDTAGESVRSATAETRAAMTNEIARRATGAATPAAIASAPPPMLGRLSNDVRGVLAAAYQRGRQQVADELSRQKAGQPVVSELLKSREGKRRTTSEALRAFAESGVRGPGMTPPTPPPSSAQHIQQQADLAAQRIAGAAQGKAAERVLAHGVTPPGGDDALGEAIDNAGEYAALRTAGSVQRVLQLGRADQAKDMRGSIANAIYSAILDSNTCDVCESRDGDESTDIDEAAGWTPNPDCEGAAYDRECRCLTLFEYDQGEGSGSDEGES